MKISMISKFQRIKMNPIFIKVFFFFFIAILISGCNGTEPDKKPPNIVLIMGDDIGFSDLGSYGGEIMTPHLDRLAAEGIRFTQFYNMAKCEPTRSVMLTGHYKGDDRSLSVANLLNKANYTTIMCGKEHFQQWVPKSAYAVNNFDHTFTFWKISEFFVPPGGEMANPFILNGRELSVDEVENEIEPLYKTDVLTDYALKFLDTALIRDNPFFLYLPYNNAHYPLQAREEDIAKFRGKYLKGWDMIRQERYDKMIELGILDRKYPMSLPEGNINRFRGHPKGDEEIREKIPLYRPWESLTEEEKDDLDLEMSVFAAMVHRLDINVGRIIAYLKANDLYDNTLIMYLSDNGSCPYDSNRDFDHPPGGADGYRTLCAAWANAGNTPFRYYKQFGHEGGSHTHFIASWPRKIEDKGGITDQPGHVVDLLPTLIDIAGIAYPDQVSGKASLPPDGRSLLPVFLGQTREEPEYFMSGHTERFRMYREGDWKIVRANQEDWELYNMNDDRTEVDNLADKQPEKVQELVSNYEKRRSEWPE
jgi:arylsulfatase